ncbi:unnamed protein product [Cuscuta epithymum]|uniref:Uncharacterized protein n=1 Tax=Cuscuta epithymum TaxID=186058 RepID=A0AAV0FHE0_9ASTE|nr:unnamed protein product [Cuscuta epithymum]
MYCRFALKARYEFIGSQNLVEATAVGDTVPIKNIGIHPLEDLEPILDFFHGESLCIFHFCSFCSCIPYFHLRVSLARVPKLDLDWAGKKNSTGTRFLVPDLNQYGTSSNWVHFFQNRISFGSFFGKFAEELDLMHS